MSQVLIVSQRTRWQSESGDMHVQIYEIAPFAEDSFVLILEKMELMLWPIVVNTKTAAAPIKTNNNEYSTISCPCSSLINSRIIDFPPGFCMVIELKHLGCVEVSGDFLIDSAHSNRRSGEGGCETACSLKQRYSSPFWQLKNWSQIGLPLDCEHIF